MGAREVLLLIHIFVLGIPMLGASIFLLVETTRIRRFLERYAVQRTIFKGILLVGYVFVFIAVMHLLEETLEWYGYELLSMEVGAIWHGATLLVLAVVAYSFHQYLKTLHLAERD